MNHRTGVVGRLPLDNVTATGSLSKIPAEERARARRYVASRATSAHDLAQLLDALDLNEGSDQ